MGIIGGIKKVLDTAQPIRPASRAIDKALGSSAPKPAAPKPAAAVAPSTNFTGTAATYGAAAGPTVTILAPEKVQKVK